MVIRPFQYSETKILEFESLLKRCGIKINSNSDLERLCLLGIEINEIYKGNIEFDPNRNIRQIFSDFSGFVDFIEKIIRNENHLSFKQIIPHLELMNFSSIPQNTKSKITDSGSNKLFELYMALCCMDFSNKVEIDNPNHSDGDNPDVILDFIEEKWAIACKVMHSDKPQTLYNRLLEGVDQINRSDAKRGIVVINFKNVFDHQNIWRMSNIKGELPKFQFHLSPYDVDKILYKQLNDYLENFVKEIGIDSFKSFSNSGKCPANPLYMFTHTNAAIMTNNNPTPTSFRTLFNIEFASKGKDKYWVFKALLHSAIQDLF